MKTGDLENYVEPLHLYNSISDLEDDKPRLFADEDVPDLEESETLARLFLNRLKDQREILDSEFSDKGLIIILEE